MDSFGERTELVCSMSDCTDRNPRLPVDDIEERAQVVAET